MSFKATVYYDKTDKLISSFRKGREKYYVFESGNILSTKDIKGFLYFECCECKTLFQQNIYHGLLDKTYVCRSCNKQGERNPFYGKTHNNSFKERLSKERKGKWGIGSDNAMHNKSFYDRWVELYGESEANRLLEQHSKNMSEAVKGTKNPFYGRKHNPNTLKENGKKHSEWWSSLSEEELEEYKNNVSLAQNKFKENNPEYYRKIKTKAAIASIKSQKRYKMNKIEKVIQEELEIRGLNFDYSVILGYKQYDFGCKEHKILIEIQGDYWHGNPNMYGDDKKPLNDVQLKKIDKDIDKKLFAESHNFKLFYIWEEEIKNGRYKMILDQIENLITT